MFYSWWNIIYLPLILISIIFNFYIGTHLSFKKNRYLFVLWIITNILLLWYFKYYDFFIENINILTSSNIGLLNLSLPLAISFFTFQQIAYLVDSYKQETKEYDFLNYMVFVTFFPQLIAWPIVHHKEMMPQFSDKKAKKINSIYISMWIFIFSIWLFKKVILADTFSIMANIWFDWTNTLNIFEAWITSLSYTFQIYFDFSWYTDMAIWLWLLFNIKLPLNFNSPYKSTNIQDFWRKWHMTLSRFLRDYIYIPLWWNRKGKLMTYRNLMITFIIGWIWHGAGWTFIFWWFLHWFSLIIFNLWSKLWIKLWPWFAWLITFNFLNITWVFFRAKEWNDAIKILYWMFNINNIILPSALENNLLFLKYIWINFWEYTNNIWARLDTPLIIFLWFIIVIYFNNSNEKLKNFKVKTSTLLLSSMAFTISILSLSKVSEFLYFNF